ncbi:MAG TPA: glycosyltransferase family 39 protein [Candidatus Polarisedimenticolia bacterium]|nr:glycosyltransferase family 39 protein [Candidatus Polarisedimenticolia bacterium]
MSEQELLAPPPVEESATPPPSVSAEPPRRSFRQWLDQNPRAWIGIIAGVGFILRAAYLWRLSRSSFYLPDRLDPLFYFNWAREIAAGHWIGDKIFVQSPLYAYLVAVFLKVLGERHIFPILQIFQILMGVGTCLLVVRIAERLFSRREAFLAGLLTAVYGPFLFYEGMVMKTFLSTFLTVYLVDLLLRSEGTQRKLLVAAGFVFALTSLVRDNFVLLFPLLIAGFFLAFPGLRLGDRLKACLLFTLGGALGILPVTARNYAVGKEFALLTTGGGEVFYIGNNADANGRYLPPPFVHATPEKEHDDFIDKASELSGRKLTPGESSSFWLKQGLQWIGANPGAWMKLELRKLMVFWNAYELPDNYNYYEVRQVLLSPLGLLGMLLFIPLRFMTFNLVAPLGLAGILLSLPQGRRLVWIYLILFGYMGTVLLFFNFSRFRVPIVPFLCLFAGLTLAALADEIRKWSGYFSDRPKAEEEPAAVIPPPWADYSRRPIFLASGAVLVLSWVAVNFVAQGGRGVFPTVQSKLSLGDAYRTQGDFLRAEKEYLVALQILGDEPMDQATAAELGVDPARMRQEVESERIAQGVNFAAVRAGLHFGLGASWVDQGKKLAPADRGKAEELQRRGIKQMEEAAKLVPFPPYMRRLGSAYADLGQSEDAEKAYRGGLLIAAEDFGLHYDLAGLLYDQGRFPEALSELRSTRTAGKRMIPAEESDYHFGVGLVMLDGYHEEGKALYHFQKAIEALPSHREAKRIRELIQELSGRGIAPVEDE